VAMTAPARPLGRVVVSLCGPSGSGKSRLAQALAERLGTATSVRVPADDYLVPANEAREAYLRQPLQYDWALLGAVLATPMGMPSPRRISTSSASNAALTPAAKPS